MNHTPQDQHIRELICELLDGELSQAQQKELLAALQSNAETARWVVDLLQDSCVLSAIHAVERPDSFIGKVLLQAEYLDTGDTFTDRVATAALEQDTMQAHRPDDEQRVEQIRRYAEHQLEAFLSEQEQLRRQHACVERRGMHFSIDLGEIVERVQAVTRRVKRATVVAALTAAIFIITAATVHAILARRVVATLNESVNAQWSEAPADEELRPGWMTLEQGYARITFKKGTNAILQAPCEFQLCSPGRMYLLSGRMTARVPREAIGFIVDTSSSRVVDFGTEFGVLTGAASGSEVHVFDGKVALRSSGQAASSTSEQQLTKGQAAAIDLAGHVRLHSLDDRPNLFARQMPDANEFGVPGKRLNLADMVGGGNGLGTGVLGRGIDPSTGRIALERKVTNGPNNGFIATPALPFIDGVFVPDGESGNPIVITSTGLTFAGCPDTKGACHEVILNGAAFQEQSFPVHLGRLAGRTYGTRMHPSIGMHVNAGITFDLDKIRAAMPEAKVTEFRALCGVSETAALYSDGYFGSQKMRLDVGFSVLVDGQVRFSRRLATVPSEAAAIQIALGKEDRFLTLMTTDCNGVNTCAWGLFAEPALELETND
jgi:hypothetical protein